MPTRSGRGIKQQQILSSSVPRPALKLRHLSLNARFRRARRPLQGDAGFSFPTSSPSRRYTPHRYRNSPAGARDEPATIGAEGDVYSSHFPEMRLFVPPGIPTTETPVLPSSPVATHRPSGLAAIKARRGGPPGCTHAGRGARSIQIHTSPPGWKLSVASPLLARARGRPCARPCPFDRLRGAVATGYRSGPAGALPESRAPRAIASVGRSRKSGGRCHLPRRGFPVVCAAESVGDFPARGRDPRS